MTLNDDSFRLLMARSQEGDRTSYRTLLENVRPWLLRYFARRAPPAMVDDLVQETLLSIHAKRATFDPHRPFLPWLAAIARYRFVDALRTLRHTEELVDDCAAIDSCEDEVISRLSLDRLFTRLTPSQARAIALTRIEGRSIADAARASGQSESSVKINVHRGLRKLAGLIESS